MGSLIIVEKGDVVWAGSWVKLGSLGGGLMGEGLGFG